MMKRVKSNKKEKNFTNMKKAVIDQIILWIMLFVIFAGFLFFIIEYSNAVKVKDNVDAIADYTARKLSLSEDLATADPVTGDTALDEIADAVNANIKDDYFANITASDIVCSDDSTATSYQVIVTVTTTLNNDFIGTNDVKSKVVVFNERGEYERTCSISIALK